jgi:hypothetical protein
MSSSSAELAWAPKQTTHHCFIFETAGGFCGIAWNNVDITRFQLPTRTAEAIKGVGRQTRRPHAGGGGDSCRREAPLSRKELLLRFRELAFQVTQHQFSHTNRGSPDGL